MSEPEIQMPSAPNPLKSKKYLRNLAIAIAAAVIITVIVTSQLANMSQANYTVQNLGHAPGSYTETALSGQIVLNTQGMYLSGFNVPDEAKTAFLHGNYTVEKNGTKGYATMTIWSQQEFINYISDKDATPCYNKDQMPYSSDNLNVTLTKGNYIILIGGVRSGQEVLSAQLDLNFTV